MALQDELEWPLSRPHTSAKAGQFYTLLSSSHRKNKGSGLMTKRIYLSQSTVEEWGEKIIHIHAIIQWVLPRSGLLPSTKFGGNRLRSFLRKPF